MAALAARFALDAVERRILEVAWEVERSLAAAEKLRKSGRAHRRAAARHRRRGRRRGAVAAAGAAAPRARRRRWRAGSAAWRRRRPGAPGAGAGRAPRRRRRARRAVARHHARDAGRARRHAGAHRAAAGRARRRGGDAAHARRLSAAGGARAGRRAGAPPRARRARRRRRAARRRGRSGAAARLRAPRGRLRGRRARRLRGGRGSASAGARCWRRPSARGAPLVVLTDGERTREPVAAAPFAVRRLSLHPPAPSPSVAAPAPAPSSEPRAEDKAPPVDDGLDHIRKQAIRDAERALGVYRAPPPPPRAPVTPLPPPLAPRPAAAAPPRAAPSPPPPKPADAAPPPPPKTEPGKKRSAKGALFFGGEADRGAAPPPAPPPPPPRRPAAAARSTRPPSPATARRCRRRRRHARRAGALRPHQPVGRAAHRPHQPPAHRQDRRRRRRAARQRRQRPPRRARRRRGGHGVALRPQLERHARHPQARPAAAQRRQGSRPARRLVASTHMEAPALPDWLARQLPFRRSLVDVGDGLRMHVMEQGSGRPVVMLHGNPTWGYLWRKVALALSGEPLRIILPDLVGLGLSDKPRDAAVHTLENHARWLGALLDTLRRTRSRSSSSGRTGAAPSACARSPIARRASPASCSPTPSSARRARASARRRSTASRACPLVADARLPPRRLSAERARPSRRAIARSIRGEVARAYRWPLRHVARSRGAAGAGAHGARLATRTRRSPRLPRCQALRRRLRRPVAIVWGDRDPVLGRVRSHIERHLPAAQVTRTRAGHFLQEEVPDAHRRRRARRHAPRVRLTKLRRSSVEALTAHM